MPVRADNDEFLIIAGNPTALGPVHVMNLKTKVRNQLNDETDIEWSALSHWQDAAFTNITYRVLLIKRLSLRNKAFTLTVADMESWRTSQGIVADDLRIYIGDDTQPLLDDGLEPRPPIPEP
jgi:hypothetical protein